MIHVIVFSSILAVTCGYALWRGGAPERLVALGMGLACIATYLVPFERAFSFHVVNADILLIDLLLLAVMIGVALWANRFWPMWVASIQALAIAIHGVKAYDPALVAWLYNAATGKIAYPMVAMLAIGVARHRHRLTTLGSDPDWTVRQQEFMAS